MRVNRRSMWLLGIYSIVLVATQLDPVIWPSGFDAATFPQPYLRGADTVIGVAVGLALLCIGAGLIVRHEAGSTWRPPALVAVIVGAAVLVGGFGVQQQYLQHRYTGRSLGALIVFPAADRWAQGIHHARIAVMGSFTILQYPLYGADLSNYVQYLGSHGPDGAFSAITSCADLRRALNSGRYSYFLTATALTNHRIADAPSDQAQWIDGDPKVRTILHVVTPPSASGSVGFELFHLGGRLDPADCTSSPKTVRPA
jgi:hypothetical protein